LKRLKEDDSRKACPEGNRRDAKHAKFHQIPLFPPLIKGDERGFLDLLAPWREKDSKR
jgi:hypothetical protein